MEKSFYTKEFILETFYWPNGTQNSGHCNKTWMTNHGYYDDLLNYYALMHIYQMALTDNRKADFKIDIKLAEQI